MSYQLIDNEELKQYEFHIEEFIPRIEYIKAKNQIFLTHTEIPNFLAGKGVGAKLVKQALEDIKQKDLTLVPLCPFVALYIKRHQKWRKLVLKGIIIS